MVLPLASGSRKMRRTSIKSLQRESGVLRGEDLSGHSFRVGAALDLLERGVSLERIMLRGGWKSDSSAMRYLRSWNNYESMIINDH
jgi:integrase